MASAVRSEADQRVVGNLPLELTSFVGRRRELADARRLFETSRLLTTHRDRWRGQDTARDPTCGRVATGCFEMVPGWWNWGSRQIRISSKIMSP